MFTNGLLAAAGAGARNGTCVPGVIPDGISTPGMGGQIDAGHSSPTLCETIRMASFRLAISGWSLSVADEGIAMSIGDIKTIVNNRKVNVLLVFTRYVFSRNTEFFM
jgi:hypothetical protein